MKILLLTALFSTQLIAVATAAERVLISDSKVATVVLNETSVRCSAIGYGYPELKINIPSLDGWTIFDHSNIRAGDLIGQPCMTAGICKGARSDRDAGNSIDDILSGGPRTIQVKVNRKIVEVKNLGKADNGGDVCNRHIEERLSTEVLRGDSKGTVAFTHLRAGLQETFPIAICK
jgi:hypothetical protein